MVSFYIILRYVYNYLFSIKLYVHEHVKMADLAQHPDHVIVPMDTQVLPVPMVHFVYQQHLNNA